VLPRVLLLLLLDLSAGTGSDIVVGWGQRAFPTTDTHQTGNIQWKGIPCKRAFFSSSAYSL
jgi:hypothetical protein